jgi:hypothetical protein
MITEVKEMALGELSKTPRKEELLKVNSTASKVQYHRCYWLQVLQSRFPVQR